MGEDESNDQKSVNQDLTLQESSSNEPMISESELAEIEREIANEPKLEIKWRHSQQVLTNKEAEILLLKKEEELTEFEKTAKKWLVLRLKHHNSTPKNNSSSRQNSLRRKKRRISNASRKVNR